MSFTDYHFEDRLMQLRVRKEHRQAELRGLQREARKADPRWMDRQRCWLLCQLGKLLVSWGTWLLQAGLPEPLRQGQ
jgi:hypothetical protein